MKILHIVRQFHPCIGGLENYVKNLASQQIEQDNDVTVLTLNRSFSTGEKLADEEVLENGIKIIRIPYFGKTKYPIAFKVLKYLKPYHVINVHAVDFFIDFLAVTKFIHRKKLVLTTHGGFFHTKWAGGLKKIFFNVVTRTTIKAYRLVIGCSDNDVNIFKKITKKIIKVENGVNVQGLSKIKKEITPGLLIYVGRIDIHKRVDLLIRVAEKLIARGNKIELKIIGPDWKNLSPELSSLAENLKIKDMVTFTGPVSDEELANLFSKAHLFLSASEYEGFGMSAIEALATGTLTILHTNNSFVKLLANKEFGALSDFSDTDKTSRIIEDFLRKKQDEYTQLSHSGRDYAFEFDWGKVAKVITDLYSKATNKISAT